MHQEQAHLDDEFKSLTNQAAEARIKLQEPTRKLGIDIGLTAEEKRHLTAEFNAALAEYKKIGDAIRANRSAYSKAADSANQNIEQVKSR